ncbi:MAG TPA: hypothetical protein VFC67_11465 [Prolixibacteraceae bacterium]|nr:hypothetical protein [Prolixibacteraceae bacterium]
MKKLFLLTGLILFGMTLSAQETFFPTKEGTVLTYQSFDKKGKESSAVKYTIKNVKGSGDNIDITYKVESFDAKEEMVFADEITIQQRGDKMYFDMSNFINKGAFQQNEEIPATVEVTGNSMEIPVNAVAGQTLPDASVAMSMKMGFINMKMSANVTNRKVEGWEDLTIKAGTFNCCRFSSDVNATVMGINVKTKNTDWYSKGIGMVKSESYDKNGKLQSTTELIEVKK